MFPRAGKLTEFVGTAGALREHDSVCVGAVLIVEANR